jgi:hypothetical protein
LGEVEWLEDSHSDGFPLCTFVPFVVDALKRLNHRGHKGTQREAESCDPVIAKRAIFAVVF